MDVSARILTGDCRRAMRLMAQLGIQVDSIVTDPPYGLQFMGREWDKLWRNQNDYVERTNGELTSRARKLPDYSATNPQQMQAWHEEWTRLALAVLKPGGHLLAFGGTRGWHRLACAVEDAGFEIRDTVAWLYGTGFPKSHDVSKGIDKAAGAEREVSGYRKHPTLTDPTKIDRQGKQQFHAENPVRDEWELTAPATPEAAQWQGWGTALKPAFEPIILARKPLSEKSVAANVLRHGTGAVNVDGCRVQTDETIEQTGEVEDLPRSAIHEGYDRPNATMFRTGKPKERAGPAHSNGRWPANVAHDGSEEVEAAFAAFGAGKSQKGKPRAAAPGDGWGMTQTGAEYTDSGTAARFFYSAKANKTDRLGSKHPTVKPVALMRWLVRLITPPGGLVLDPFAGTGTTGQAAIAEGMRAVLIEREAEYVADIKARLAHISGGDTPLFAGVTTLSSPPKVGG